MEQFSQEINEKCHWPDPASPMNFEQAPHPERIRTARVEVNQRRRKNYCAGSRKGATTHERPSRDRRTSERIGRIMVDSRCRVIWGSRSYIRHLRNLDVQSKAVRLGVWNDSFRWKRYDSGDVLTFGLSKRSRGSGACPQGVFQSFRMPGAWSARAAATVLSSARR